MAADRISIVSDTDSNLPKVSGASHIANSLGRFLDASYRPGGLSEYHNRDAFHGRLNQRLESADIRTQKNLENIFEAAFAAAEIAGAGEVDEDWLARFVAYAGLICHERMQRVWGLILACEFEKPGSISLSTLACLSNMAPPDLALWERIGRMIFPEGYVFKVGGRNQFERFGVSREDILNIQTIGLFQEAQDLSVTFGGAERGLTFSYKGAEIILRNPDLTLFSLPAFKLTSAGLELFSLLIDEPVNEDYLRAFGSELAPNGYDYRIRLADGSLVQ